MFLRKRILDTASRSSKERSPHVSRSRHVLSFAFLLFSLLFLSLTSACAGQQTTPNPAGTMNQDPPIPQLTEATHGILDTTGTISPSFLEQLMSRSDEVQAHGYQMAVIFFNNLASDPHQFATAVFNANGIGFRGKDNGVLFVLYLQKPGTDGHAPWLSYITGGGISGALPDTLMDDYVQTTFVPARAQGNWQQGLLAFYEKVYAAELDPTIASQWQANHARSSPGSGSSGETTSTTFSVGILILVCLAFITWLVISAVVASRRRDNFFSTALRLLGRFLILLALLSRATGGGSSSGRRPGGFGPWGGGGRSPSSGGDV